MKNRSQPVTLLGVFLVLTIVAMSLSGCAGFGQRMKSFLGGGSTSEPTPVARPTEKTFGDNSDIPPTVNRRYRRVTRQSLEGASQLDANAGSLWVNEGQGAYLFSQNIMRMLGDPLTVKIEGDPKDQLVAKVDTIKKLWEKIENRKAALRAPAAEKAGGEQKPADGASEEPKEKEAVATKPEPSPKSQSDFAVKTVPTRIVERLVDGNYRVKGSQPVMVGSREYKVIVTGIVRAEDFTDEGIAASQLIDPKFDIVSPRRKEME